MFKYVIFASSFIVATNAVGASEPARSAEPAPQVLDTMQACYYKGIPTSKGMVEKVGDREFECMRAKSQNGFRTDGMPLEWVEITHTVD